MSINLESITVDTNVLQSDNWDGSVDGSGNINAYGGQGWAITGSGEVHLAFSGGDININDEGIELEATSAPDNEQALTWMDAGTMMGRIWGEPSGEFKVQSYDTRPLVLSGNGEVRLVAFGGAIKVFDALDWRHTTSTSASAGINGDVPGQVEGYLDAKVDGDNVRIPYYGT